MRTSPCKNCGGIAFYANRKCKPCTYASNRKYILNHPEKSKQYQATDRRKNPNRQKDWRIENRDKCAGYTEKWRVKNPNRRSEYHLKNKEKCNAQNARWYRENKDSVRAIRQGRRLKIKNSGDRLSVGLVRKLIILQKGKCACCRKKLEDDYHLDHIIPIALDGRNIDDNIQLLCPNCNLSKGAKHPLDFMQSKGYLI